MNLKTLLQKKSGQAAIETILLFGLVVICWNLAIIGLQKVDIYQKMFGEPWKRLSNIIEYGIPSGAANQAVAPRHPTSKDRHQTPVEAY